MELSFYLEKCFPVKSNVSSDVLTSRKLDVIFYIFFTILVQKRDRYSVPLVSAIIQIKLRIGCCQFGSEK